MPTRLLQTDKGRDVPKGASNHEGDTTPDGRPEDDLPLIDIVSCEDGAGRPGEVAVVVSPEFGVHRTAGCSKKKTASGPEQKFTGEETSTYTRNPKKTSKMQYPAKLTSWTMRPTKAIQ